VRFSRFALPGLLLVGLGAIVYVLMRAALGPPETDALARYATGSFAALDVSRVGAAQSLASFQDAAGAPVTLERFRGKTILVNFWATWCAPCEAEMPALAALQKAKGGADFEVVAISVDASEDAAYAQKRLAELGAANLTFFIAPPEAYEIVYESGVQGFPTTIFYAPDGTERARFSGAAEWSSYEAAALIEAVKKK
jgi:thiol-disulfide isomerase/thioredoxin